MGVLTVLPPTNLIGLTPDTRSPDGIDQGWWNPITNGSTDADILAGLTDGLIFVCQDTPPITSVEMLFGWDEVTPIFSLDGGPLMNYTDVPTDLMVNGTIILGAEWNNGPSGPYLARFDGSEITQGVHVQFLFFDLAATGLPLVTTDPGDFISKSVFINGTFRLELAGPSSTPGGGLVVLGAGGAFPFTLTGLFASVSYQQQWEVFINDEANPIPAGEPIKPGDRIRIEVPTPMDEGDHDLINVDQVQFTFGDRTITINKDGTFTITDGDDTFFTQEDSPYVIYWDLILIIITIPFYGFEDYEGPVDIAPVVNPPTPFPPTEFSGSITIGAIEILFTDASGVYNITPNKTNDTIYDPARDGTTLNVAIPKPYIRTGFIGS